MEHFFANNRTLSKLRKGPLEKYLRDFAENLELRALTVIGFAIRYD